MDEGLTRLPLWKNCLDAMRKEGFTFGSTWRAEYFEKQLKLSKDTPQFQFAVLNIRKAIEEEDGYYIRATDNGEIFQVVEDFAHEDVAAGMDSKQRRYNVRSINIRSATLMNPNAKLTADQREKMEKNLEKATVRLLLISRQKTVEDIIRKNSPKTLENRPQ